MLSAKRGTQMPATNYDNLKTALQARVTELDFAATDPQKHEALALIDQYVAALTAQASETTSSITGYSISGRSVTKSSGSSGGAAMLETVSRLKRQVYAILYGGIRCGVDFREKTLDAQFNT